jgi:capsular polysaccharide biosynthesis protein
VTRTRTEPQSKPQNGTVEAAATMPAARAPGAGPVPTPTPRPARKRTQTTPKSASVFAKPSAPAEPIVPFEPEEPVEALAPIEPIEPFEPAEINEPPAAIEPEEPAQAVVPEETSEALAPEEPAEPIEAVAPPEPPAPEPAVEPVAPVEPTPTPQAAAPQAPPAPPVQPVVPQQPAPAAEPTQSFTVAVPFAAAAAAAAQPQVPIRVELVMPPAPPPTPPIGYVLPTPEPPQPESPSAVTILWRRLKWILLIAIILSGVTYKAVGRLPPEYSADATIRVTLQQSSGVPNETLLAGNELAAQYAQLVTANTVQLAAARELKVDPSVLDGKLTAAPIAQLNLIDVAGSGTNADAAQRRANAGARALTAYILASNTRQSAEFVKRASGQLTQAKKDIAQLQRQLSKATAQLHAAKTGAQITDAQTTISGLQSQLQSAISLRSGTLSHLQEEAALGQPAVDVVAVAGPGSPTQPSPKIFALIGLVAGAVVAGQIFVLVDTRRRPKVKGRTTDAES